MAKNKKKKVYCGIGGQAVLEGIMMKNSEHYSVAIRKPDHTIEVDLDNYQGILPNNKLAKLPFIRGVVNFIDSLILGMRTLNYSAEFYIDEEEADKSSKADKKVDAEQSEDNIQNTDVDMISSEKGNTEEKIDDESDKKSSDSKKADKKNSETGITALTGVIAVILALGLFMVLPVYLTKLVSADIRNESLVAVIEGLIRLAVFLIYIVAISLMQDIKRVYMYHGAEHKCINCIERGKPLNVQNVMRSSRLHKRCGTSFLLFVVLVSIVVFFFIRVDNMALKIVIRIALIPVIAGISYELLRLAGRFENILTNILSAPGMLLQRLTTREPDEEMVEVAIAAVEAVFDWKAFLLKEFGYDYNDWNPNEETEE